MKAIFAAGGTAGHINPALAIADKLKSVFPEAEILFIGTPQGMEARLVTKAGYDFAPVEMAGFQRKISIQNIGRNARAAYLYLFAAKHAVRKYSGNSSRISLSAPAATSPEQSWGRRRRWE